MRILFRYVFREFCVPLAYCLAGFMSIYVLFELFGIFNRILEAKPGLVREQVFYAHFVKNIESRIKSNQLINTLKMLIQQQGYYF